MPGKTVRKKLLEEGRALWIIKSLKNNKEQYDLKKIKYRNRYEVIVTGIFKNMNIFGATG